MIQFEDSPTPEPFDSAKPDYFTFPSHPGVRFWKEKAGRAMTEEDYRTILASERPVELEGFISRAGKPFSAPCRFNPETKTVEFVFDERG
ncbi:hypothetical protein SAMN05444156_2175 [Verrucomicrobium sp. GAS474]|uniref:topoisomerase C-terminal repeat-containing protein n=1 Tax=Verrucomicrobium sp. GAS474 TaxID=1882831 RepID=UPI00087DF23F|nr:topoisomerase C-terminal repeat-containing protein [Verrucomicrobium sp. GAS474]SDU13638.1 hypothetical protein SAMN05444156_2175 [Verrucomicrobium sp. GAS474]